MELKPADMRKLEFTPEDIERDFGDSPGRITPGSLHRAQNRGSPSFKGYQDRDSQYSGGSRKSYYDRPSQVVREPSPVYEPDLKVSNYEEGSYAKRVQSKRRFYG